MPEGDTIFKLAAALRPNLLGEKIDALWTRSAGDVAELVGRRVSLVEAIGKHLLVHLEGDVGLRAHLGIGGSVHRYRPNERWRRTRDRAVMTLATAQLVFVFFDAKDAEIVDTRRLAVHPRLSTLGPDLLGERLDMDDVVRRARSAVASTIAELLLDQRVAAGIGNVYKSEVLFLERVDPFAAPSGLPDATVERLYARARALLQANLGSRPRTTVPSTLRTGGSPRLWVYGRARRPCLRCGQPVARAYHGDDNRSTFYCARCQQGPEQRRP